MSERRFTHLRLRQYPDGGIARLRVLRRGGARSGVAGRAGDVRPGGAGERRGGGGRLRPLLLTARAHHPARSLPARWTTAGRPGGAVTAGTTGSSYRLVEQGEIRAVEIDTAYLKGNAAGWATSGSATARDGEWVQLLPRVRLQPDTRAPLPGRPDAGHPRPDRHLPRRRDIPAAAARLADRAGRGPAGRAAAAIS